MTLERGTPMTLTSTRSLDLKGLSCPMPIVKTAKAMKELTAGDLVEVLATDPGSQRDFVAWAKATGNVLVESSVSDNVYRYVLRKG